jgi:hypothetical protein
MTRQARSHSLTAAELALKDDDSWESALVAAAQKAVAEMTPAQKLEVDVLEHRSSPDVPLGPQDKK